MIGRIVLQTPILMLLGSFLILPAAAQDLKSDLKLDARVRGFLDKHKYDWRDMNVPFSDGQVLYDLITENKYRQALEIGTSTGHSGIWIAWALSKTGGKLITVEIDEDRYREALANFKEAGLLDYIDARLADAHTLVPSLEGPFDFVFCDADKNWYKNYLKDVLPKMKVGGCFAAHNVSERRRWANDGFLDYAESLPNLKTSIVGSSISVSYKIR